jgi:hypothetical protein
MSQKNHGMKKTGEWSLEDEGDYEKIDRDITQSMLSAAKNCGS